MYASAFIALAFSSLAARAVTVVSPTDTTVWASGTNSQVIQWNAVNTDATTFAIQLVNQAGFLSNSPVTLIANQSTGSSDQVNEATVTYPGGSWPTGTAFQINLVSSATGNSAIYAQSQQFNITASASSSSSSSSSSSAASSSSSGTAPTTLSQAASSTVMTVTASSSASASADIPNASTSAKSGASALVPSTLLVVMAAACKMLL